MFVGPWGTTVSDPTSNDISEIKEVRGQCPKCSGTGILLAEEGLIAEWVYRKCKECEGTGKVVIDVIIN